MSGEFIGVCSHQRVGFAQTERLIMPANGEYEFLLITDAIIYCMDCGIILGQQPTQVFNDLVDFSGKVEKDLNPCTLNIGQVKQK